MAACFSVGYLLLIPADIIYSVSELLRDIQNYSFTARQAAGGSRQGVIAEGQIDF